MKDLGNLYGSYRVKLSAAETKYSAFDGELLAIYLAIKHFRYGTVYTDQKPLITAITSLSEESPRQTRHLDFIAQFTTDVQHISGVDSIDKTSALNFKDLAKAQESDDELKELLDNSSRPAGSKFKLELTILSDLKLYCETSTGVHRPFVPTSQRHAVFNALHGLSHPSIRATRNLISSRYFWPNMNNNIADWVRSCLGCQLSKVQRHTKSEHGHFELPSTRFEHIHMDVVGPLPPSDGYIYILTIVDRFTRWPEAYPMRDSTAATIAKTFVEQYVSRFGIPLEITTDQGSPFESKLFSQLTRLLGAHRIRTTAYHPQANGMVERLHRQLKASLKARGDVVHWSTELPLILLGIRAAVKDELKCSPAELVYGQVLKLPGEFFVTSSQDPNPDPSDFVGKLRANMRKIIPVDTRKSTSMPIFIPKALDNCEYVFVRIDKVRTGLSLPYEGPYRVIRRFRKYFVIDQNGRNVSISIDRLKPAHGILSLAKNNHTVPRKTVRFQLPT